MKRYCSSCDKDAKILCVYCLMRVRARRVMAIAAIALGVTALSAAPALANCQTQTVTYNGRTVWCTTCCYGGVCSTNCR